MEAALFAERSLPFASLFEVFLGARTTSAIALQECHTKFKVYCVQKWHLPNLYAGRERLIARH